MRSSIVLAALVFVLAFAGCGGGSSGAQSGSAIPGEIGNRLADQSDAVAASLESGDQCGAAQKADDLKTAADEAITGGQIPIAYRNELERTVTDLQNEVNCSPTPASDNGDEHGKGKEKGHKKHDDQGTTTTTTTTTGTTTGEGD
jgi:hypothetical protein